MKNITLKHLKHYSKQFNKSSKNLLAKNSINNNTLTESIIENNNLYNDNEIFSHKIDVKTIISDQKHSGRCWIFSFLNILRLKMIQKYNLDDKFEFSHIYMTFWHYFESANYFLEKIIETKDSKIDDRFVSEFLKNPVSGGGNWHMLVNIVKKYGIIPKKNMIETFHSNDTNELELFLNNTLRNYAYKIRNKKEESIEKMMEHIYKILVIFLSEPPTNFYWEYYTTTKNKEKYVKTDNITPIIFYKKYIPFDMDEYITLINYPCETKPFYRKYNVKYSNNMVNGCKQNYYNLPMKDIKYIARESIKKNEALWMGCDIEKDNDQQKGILDPNIFNSNILFDSTNEINDKCNKLDYQQGVISHAMIIKGTNIIHYGKENKYSDKENEYSYYKENEYSDKWLIENSWGPRTGENGCFTMSDLWFDENVYIIVANKKFIPKNIIKEVEKHEAIMLPSWCPFGDLLQ